MSISKDFDALLYFSLCLVGTNSENAAISLAQLNCVREKTKYLRWCGALCPVFNTSLDLQLLRHQAGGAVAVDFSGGCWKKWNGSESGGGSTLVPFDDTGQLLFSRFGSDDVIPHDI